MIKNIMIGIFAAVLVVALGTAFYNVAQVEAAGGNVFSGLFTKDIVNDRLAMLESIPATEITDSEALALIKLASYSMMIEDLESNSSMKWGINGAGANNVEQPSIMEDFDFLFDRYNIIDPSTGEVGIYTDQEILSVFQISIALADLDKPSAIKGVAYAYEILISSTLDAIEVTDNDDILYTYQFIMNHDTNHFKNWVNLFQAETGEKYFPQVISQELYDGLMDGTVGRNGNEFGLSLAVRPEPEISEDSTIVPSPVDPNQSNGQVHGQGQQGTNQFTGEFITIHGEVLSYEYGTLSILADEGTMITATVGNVDYANSLGFAPLVGDFVTITGAYGEDSMLSVFSITMDSTLITFTFRSTSGRPDWAGGGGGSGNGAGNK